MRSAPNISSALWLVVMCVVNNLLSRPLRDPSIPSHHYFVVWSNHSRMVINLVHRSSILNGLTFMVCERAGGGIHTWMVIVLATIYP